MLQRGWCGSTWRLEEMPCVFLGIKKIANCQALVHGEGSGLHGDPLRFLLWRYGHSLGFWGAC